MDFTSEISKLYSISPLDVLNEDKDRVIMLVNYFIEKGNLQPNKVDNITEKENDKNFWGMV